MEELKLRKRHSCLPFSIRMTRALPEHRNPYYRLYCMASILDLTSMYPGTFAISSTVDSRYTVELE